MPMLSLMLSVLIAFAPLTQNPPPVPGLTVTVTVDGARNDEGQVLVAFFDTDRGFPRELDRAAYVFTAALSQGRAVAEVEVEPGRYAVMAVHDADADGAVKTNWLGLPKEGIALSNWDGGRPRFLDSAMPIAEGAVVALSLTYR